MISIRHPAINKQLQGTERSRKKIQETEQPIEPYLNMKEILESSNRNLKINLIDILSALVEKNWKAKHVYSYQVGF